MRMQPRLVCLETRFFVSLIRSDVKVREYGLEMIEVTDNGFGIDPADYEMLSTL